MEISRDFLKALQNPSEARATRNARKEAEEKLRDAMHSAPGGNGFKFSVLKPKGVMWLPGSLMRLITL